MNEIGNNGLGVNNGTTTNLTNGGTILPSNPSLAQNTSKENPVSLGNLPLLSSVNGGISGMSALNGLTGITGGLNSSTLLSTPTSAISSIFPNPMIQQSANFSGFKPSTKPDFLSNGGEICLPNHENLLRSTLRPQSAPPQPHLSGQSLSALGGSPLGSTLGSTGNTLGTLGGTFGNLGNFSNNFSNLGNPSAGMCNLNKLPMNPSFHPMMMQNNNLVGGNSHHGNNVNNGLHSHHGNNGNNGLHGVPTNGINNGFAPPGCIPAGFRERENNSEPMRKHASWWTGRSMLILALLVVALLLGGGWYYYKYVYCKATTNNKPSVASSPTGISDSAKTQPPTKDPSPSDPPDLGEFVKDENKPEHKSADDYNDVIFQTNRAPNAKMNLRRQWDEEMLPRYPHRSRDSMQQRSRSLGIGSREFAPRYPAPTSSPNPRLQKDFNHVLDRLEAVQNHVSQLQEAQRVQDKTTQRIMHDMEGLSCEGRKTDDELKRHNIVIKHHQESIQKIVDKMTTQLHEVEEGQEPSIAEIAETESHPIVHNNKKPTTAVVAPAVSEGNIPPIQPATTLPVALPIANRTSNAHLISHSDESID